MLDHNTLVRVMIAGVLATACAGPALGSPEPEPIQPGLWAKYRSLADPAARCERIEAKPAFFLGDSSPDPALPDGPFEAVWRGLIQVREARPITFRAKLGGSLSITVDGTAVLQGTGDRADRTIGPGPALDRPPGWYPLEIRSRSTKGVPARLQVLWESDAFAVEPVPAWRLGHTAADLPATFARQQQIARGRAEAQRLGCAGCHARALPGVAPGLPGPSLADAAKRLGRDWLVRWLVQPSGVRPEARMPALFGADRRGYVEAWIVAAHLARTEPTAENGEPGEHRLGRRSFIGLGCAACHVVPDVDPGEQKGDLGRVPLVQLADRFGGEALAQFLRDPRGRYPDGRMPDFGLAPDVARAIAAYLRLWSPAAPGQPATPPSDSEIADSVRQLGVTDTASAAATILRRKHCAACHPGLEPAEPPDLPIAPSGSQGCLSESGTPHFALGDSVREDLLAYLAVAAKEHPPSPVVRRGEALRRAGCVQCHQRDSERPPPIEIAGSTLGGAHLSALPFQRTPRLSHPHQKFLRGYLEQAVRDGVSGLRPAGYTYRMPRFGPDAALLVQALAEQDGERPDLRDEPSVPAGDPTAGSLVGPTLVGPQGYGCISCHLWNGTQLSQPDPAAEGPDLTRVTGRIRRAWFDRFLEGPARFAPGTPMPAIFVRGQPALLTSVLNADPAKQRDALWNYLALGKSAPPPKPPAPLPIDAPTAGKPPLVAQIPIHLPDRPVVESVCLLTDDHDLLIYDLKRFTPHAVFTGANILRNVQARTRQFLASGTAAPEAFTDRGMELAGHGAPVPLSGGDFRGYDVLADGARLRWDAHFGADTLPLAETYRITRGATGGRLVRTIRTAGIPAGRSMILKTAPDGVARFTPEAPEAAVTYPLSPARPAPAWSERPVGDAAPIDGSLERPGYRATALPRPKTVSGEDRIMPGALAVGPRDGRLYVASLKTGELFALQADGKRPQFVNYARGLFQDALSLLAEDDALYVLHRRNLTRLTDTDGDGLADRFDRVAALPHGVADTYDYAYGLVRDKQGAFIISYAPYADRTLPGAGGAVRLKPGEPPHEIAYGFRNPLGWCVGPEREVFFTDNQGEWVATNKLCHFVEGRFYGFPNRAQPEHAKRPRGKAAVWIPYAWAKSINGVAYDHTAGAFGPFAGQFFLAELMFGGAMLRADVERVNGEYQGMCIPFWGKGLLGPVSLAFDPRGALYVGGITEPGWMAQPDRGAIFRIDFTGPTPFELQTIRARPDGFRLVFTEPVDRASAGNPASYRVEHFRYEYTGAYGSPELDRTRDSMVEVRVSDDGRSVDVGLPALVQDRVYLIAAPGVRSRRGQSLVYSTGAYTLNEVPAVRDGADR